MFLTTDMPFRTSVKKHSILNVEKWWAKAIWFLLIAGSVCLPYGFNQAAGAIIVIILLFKRKIEDIAGGMSP